MAKFIRVRKYVGDRDGDSFFTIWLNVDKIVCFYQGPFITGHHLLTTIEYEESRISIAETVQEITMLIEQAK